MFNSLRNKRNDLPIEIKGERNEIKPVHIPGLDGIRGLAALMILFLHFVPNYDQANHPFLYYVRKLAIVGQCGVPLFFVLSGFLITRILLYSKFYPDYFKLFYVKRALRIFPLYYLYLVINFFLIPLINNLEIPNWSDTWYYYFYFQNVIMTFNWKVADLPHLWSLAVEEHFYFVWPFVIYYCSNKIVFKIILSILLFAFICRIILVHFGIGTYYFTLTTFDSLAIGAFLAFNEQYKWLNKKNIIYIGLTTFTILFIAFPFATGLGNNFIQYLKNPVISIFCMSLIGLIILNNHLLNNIFTSRFLRYTGKISYGLYVLHPLGFGLIKGFLHINNFLLDLLCCFSCTYLIATLSYYFFEIRFLKLKSKIIV